MSSTPPSCWIESCATLLLYAQFANTANDVHFSTDFNPQQSILERGKIHQAHQKPVPNTLDIGYLGSDSVSTLLCCVRHEDSKVCVQ